MIFVYRHIPSFDTDHLVELLKVEGFKGGCYRLDVGTHPDGPHILVAVREDLVAEAGLRDAIRARTSELGLRPHPRGVERPGVVRATLLSR